MFFVAVVGFMIGAQVTSDLIGQFRYIWMSLIGVTLLVPLAFRVNYLVFRSIGRYNAVTAYIAPRQAA